MKWERSVPQLCSSCESRERRALVSILFGYEQGRPLLKHYCLHCADTAVPPARIFRPRLKSLGGVRFVVQSAALLFGLLALLADTSLLHANSGFGRWQWLACGAGLALVLLGGLLRTAIVSAVGLAAVGFGLFADVLFAHSAPGFGWKQSGVLCLALLLLVACSVRRLPRRRDSLVLAAQPRLQAQAV